MSDDILGRVVARTLEVKDGRLTVRLLRQAPMNAFMRERLREMGHPFDVDAPAEWAVNRGCFLLDKDEDDMEDDETNVAKAYRLLLRKTRQEMAETIAAEGRFRLPDEMLPAYVGEKMTVIFECLDAIAAARPAKTPDLADRIKAYEADRDDTGDNYRIDAEGLTRNARAPLADVPAPERCRNVVWARTGGGPKTGCDMVIGTAGTPIDGSGPTPVGVTSRCKGALGRCPYGVISRPGAGPLTATEKVGPYGRAHTGHDRDPERTDRATAEVKPFDPARYHRDPETGAIAPGEGPEPHRSFDAQGRTADDRGFNPAEDE